MRICYDQRTGSGCRTANSDSAIHCRQCGRPLAFALHLHDADVQIGSYQIVRAIGHGGFGAVYEAINQHPPPERVALKENFDPDNMSQLQREFAVLRHLHHDNLPQYYATFEAQGNAYLVMELVPGQSLSDIQRQSQGRLPETQVLGYAVQLCDVLSYLHSQNPPVLHRDIKPANIRFTPSGLIKLVDFGLFKQGTQTTTPSRRGLSVAYAPIEQYGGQSYRTDPRSDIYSLGATLYHLLTGQEPLSATERIGTTPDPLPSPLHYNPRLSPHVAQAILKAMALFQQDRFPDAITFKQALMGGVGTAWSSAGSQTVAAPPPTREVIALERVPTLPERVPTVIDPGIVCAECRTPHMPDEIYCQNCGYQLVASSKICPACRCANPATARFCTACGRRV